MAITTSVHVYGILKTEVTTNEHLKKLETTKFKGDRFGGGRNDSDKDNVWIEETQSLRGQ